MAAWAPYCGPGATPADLAARWNLDPILLVVLAAAAILSARRRSGAGLTAVGVLAVIFVSPLCALSSALFSARTVHHVLLVALAAPLAAWAMPEGRRIGLAAPTLTGMAIFWAWHAPAAYALALSNDAAYWAMQLSLLASSVWFWIAVRRASAPSAVGALLAATVLMGLLGALLTFGGRAVYEPHFVTALAWGLTPLQDQQAAGLIMWVPAAGVYLAGALAILGRWIGPGAQVRAA